jgi:phosphatidylserine decarboxylase
LVERHFNGCCFYVCREIRKGHPVFRNNHRVAQIAKRGKGSFQ